MSFKTIHTNYGLAAIAATLLPRDVISPDAVNRSMSIRLLTTSTDLTTGMIWNNAGTIAIVS